MRNFSFKDFSCDKKYLIASLVTLLCSIMCGIVLFKLSNINIYFVGFANDYICNVFKFKNSSIIFPHLLSDLFYIYIFFFISYFTKLKFLTLIFVFVRGIYFTVYAAILISLNSLGGITVAILVFIPSSLISFIIYFITAECCRVINKKIVFFIPAVLALANTLILLILINVVFRVIIVIV